MQHIYLLVSDGFYKIGVANDVASRIAQLATGNPHPIILVSSFSFENAEVVEKVIHQRYQEFRIRGEWFALDKNIKNEFNEICTLLGGKSHASGFDFESQSLEDEEEIQEFLLDNANIRIETRLSNGKIRGFALRERNKDRKLVRFIGQGSEEFDEVLNYLGKTDDEQVKP